MHLSFHDKRVPAALVRRWHQLSVRQVRAAASAAFGLSGVLGFVGHALAQNAPGSGAASSPTGGIGAQLNLMSGESVNAGGIAFAACCYLAAACCFFFGVWSAWQSRQPQNREAGYVPRAMAGLVLCGLFASAGAWINKAAITASGGNASISDNPQMVQFSAGGGSGN